MISFRYASASDVLDYYARRRAAARAVTAEADLKAAQDRKAAEEKTAAAIDGAAAKTWSPEAVRPPEEGK